MYLSKQWRESRIISIIAALALLLMLALVLKAHSATGEVHFQDGDHVGFAFVFVPIFYVEALLVAFWGWLAAGIGTGKNLGDESGSFLFTRPRRRSWFVWNDWGYAMGQIALIVLLANLMLGLFLRRILGLMHSPAVIQMPPAGQPLPLFIVMLLVSIGVLVFAGFIYGLTYLCTLLIKRASGVMLGAGVLVAYAILRGLLSYYYPSIRLPNVIPDVFNFDHHSFNGFADHLGISFIARAVAMLLLPVAAQAVIERSEI